MMRWLWRDQAVSTDPSDTVERSFRHPKSELLHSDHLRAARAIRSTCAIRTFAVSPQAILLCLVTANIQYNLANAETDFSEHLAVEDYYQEGQKVAGEWFGIGAVALGLSGNVGEAEFLDLCENQHPQTGDCLTQRKNSVREEDGQAQANRRIFYDFTFSPPKSVSIAALVAGDERIIESHGRAVRAALLEFETFAATRVRKNRANDSRLTKNVVAALFTHDTSRAHDPHLHTHCIVFNATLDPEEKRWKALQNHEMLRARKYVEAVYYHELAKDLHRFGYRIRNRARGDFEIEGVLDALCERFSKRHEQIDEAQAALLRTKPELAEANQKDLREHLATAERARRMRDVARPELQRLWEEQLTTQDAEALRTLVTHSPRPTQNESEAVAAAIQWAEEHVFDRRSVVPEHEVWRQALIRARGEDLNVARVKTATHRGEYIRDSSAVANVTTQDVLAREWEIVRAGSEGVSSFGPLVDSIPTVPATFVGEQRMALAHLLSSRDFITLFRGGAGTGKTFVLKTLIEKLRDAGHSTTVVAPQRQQVVDLATNGFPSPTTLAEFLTRKAMKPGAVVVLDEAGQVGGRQMCELVRLVQENGGRPILSGDTRQHGPVEASDAMLALELHANLKPAELRKIRRQNPKLGKNSVEKHSIRRYRRAVADAAAGKVKDSFDGLQKLGAIVSCPLGNQAERISDEYVATMEAGYTLVAVGQTWNEVNRVNEHVRSRLRDEGLLGADETEVETLEHVDLTNAQKRDSRYLPSNAVVVFNQPVCRVARGARGTFVGAIKRGHPHRGWRQVATGASQRTRSHHSLPAAKASARPR
jgi:conjugative relaxase-like TrwC/TraI family protein